MGLDTNIYPQYLHFSWGSSEEAGPKFDLAAVFVKGNYLSEILGASSHLRPVSSATVPKDPSQPQRQIRRVRASAISASTAGETIRHSWVFASSPLFRKD